MKQIKTLQKEAEEIMQKAVNKMKDENERTMRNAFTEFSIKIVELQGRIK